MRPRQPWFRNSKNAWYVEFNGAQVRRADGPKNAQTKAEAERALARLTLKAAGELPKSQAALTVAAVCDLFLDFSKRHHEPATYK